MGKASYITIANHEYLMKKSPFSLNYSPVHVTWRTTGKMQNMVSTSTACTCNPLCLARMQNDKMVCAKCFSERIKRTAFLKAMEENYNLLTSVVLPLELLPVFPNISISRIEAFGDVANTIQAINYCNMHKVNPNVTFGWWSKNLNFIEEAYEIVGGKPKNSILVQSSPFINKQSERNPIADKVFTVYTKEYAEKNNININCGSRCCITCKTCYEKDSEVYINELLK